MKIWDSVYVCNKLRHIFRSSIKTVFYSHAWAMILWLDDGSGIKLLQLNWNALKLISMPCQSKTSVLCNSNKMMHLSYEKRKFLREQQNHVVQKKEKITGWPFRRFIVAAAAVFSQMVAARPKLNLRSSSPTAAAAIKILKKLKLIQIKKILTSRQTHFSIMKSSN